MLEEEEADEGVVVTMEDEELTIVVSLVGEDAPSEVLFAQSVFVAVVADVVVVTVGRASPDDIDPDGGPELAGVDG